MKTASNTHFNYEEQILLNDNYWKLNKIFEKGIVELEEIKILEKQENDSSAVYLIYINFFSNSNVQGACGIDATDEKLVWVSQQRKKSNNKKQLFDLTICRGNIANNLEGKIDKNWDKISINISEINTKSTTNISISKKDFLERFNC